MWTHLLSVFTTLICIGIVIKRYPSSTQKDIRYVSLTGLSLWFIGDIVYSISFAYQEIINVILQSLALSLLLTVLLIFIRSRKPIIFRYPYYMVFIPLLIPIAQFIVMDTQVMREIIFMLIQGVSILVFALLSTAYAKEIENKNLTIIGIILLIGGFIFFWILKDHFIVFEWSYALTNSLGVVVSIYSFSDLLQLNDSTEITFA